MDDCRLGQFHSVPVTNIATHCRIRNSFLPRFKCTRNSITSTRASELNRDIDENRVQGSVYLQISTGIVASRRVCSFVFSEITSSWSFSILSVASLRISALLYRPVVSFSLSSLLHSCPGHFFKAFPSLANFLLRLSLYRFSTMLWERLRRSVLGLASSGS